MCSERSIAWSTKGAIYRNPAPKRPFIPCRMGSINRSSSRDVACIWRGGIIIMSERTRTASSRLDPRIVYQRAGACGQSEGRRHHYSEVFRQTASVALWVRPRGFTSSHHHHASPRNTQCRFPSLQSPGVDEEAHRCASSIRTPWLSAKDDRPRGVRVDSERPASSPRAFSLW